MQRYPPSGISVLVVGAGLGGLTTAIELYRKGHDVRIIDRRDEFEPFGDLVGIGLSALWTMKRSWPGFMESFTAQALDPVACMKTWDGTDIGTFPIGKLNEGDTAVPTSRHRCHSELYKYARSLGLAVEVNMKCERYYEDPERKKGGVVLESGEKIEADVVVAADGVGSKSWELVTGEKDRPVSSGFAIYRATYPLEAALASPVLRKEFEGYATRMLFFIGSDTHCVISKSRDDVSFLLTYKDDGSAEESWSKTAPAEKALKWMQKTGANEFLQAMVRAVPNQTVVDWKLMWRNPQPKWTSPHGYVVQAGDSCHAFLPTSASGATMAMEDGMSIAACLQLGGKSNIPLAMRVHNKLRFERVSCAQKMGFKNRQMLHKTKLDQIMKEPEKMSRLVGKWVMTHDPEQYVYDNYANCANHVVEGAPFENTNMPLGYKYEPWSIHDLLQAAEEGREVVDAGDWS